MLILNHLNSPYLNTHRKLEIRRIIIVNSSLVSFFLFTKEFSFFFFLFIFCIYLELSFNVVVVVFTTESVISRVALFFFSLCCLSL